MPKQSDVLDWLVKATDMSLPRIFEYGPLAKSNAAFELEQVIHAILNDEDIVVNFNIFNELIIATAQKSFNITELLSHNPHLEHIYLSDKNLDTYVKFIRSTRGHEIKLNNHLNPDEDIYKKRDPEGEHAHLHYGEKLAISLYTTGFYREIQEFLRNDGRVGKLHQIDKSLLPQAVLEVLLTAIVASHGLNKPSPSFTDVDETRNTIRVEHATKNDEFLKKRIKEYSEYKASHSKGLTSASSILLALNNVNTIYQENGSLNPIGKNVQKLSVNPKEDEILYPQGAQFYYTALNIDQHNNYYFAAKPLRTISGINPYSYSQLNYFRKKLKYIIENLNKFYEENNHGFIKGLFDTVDNKEKLACVQDVITIINKTIQQKGISIEDLKTVTNTIVSAKEKNIKLVSQAKYKASEGKTGTVLQEALTIVNELIANQAEFERNKKLKTNIKNSFNENFNFFHDVKKHEKNFEFLKTDLFKAIEYVWKNFLSQPYTEDYIWDMDLELPVDGKIIHRPNHGLPYTLRVASYIPLIIEYFKQFAKDEGFRKFCQELLGNQKEIEKIQSAMLFDSAGRKSDVGFYENAKAYARYVDYNAKYFKEYAQTINMPNMEINKYSESILNRGIPNYHKDKVEAELIYLHFIMQLSHSLDLQRCATKQKYLASIAMPNSPSVEASPQQQQALNNLFDIVTKCIEATGDRFTCKYYAGEIVNCDQYYKKQLFLETSQNPALCWGILQSVIAESKISKVVTNQDEPIPVEIYSTPAANF